MTLKGVVTPRDERPEVFLLRATPFDSDIRLLAILHLSPCRCFLFNWDNNLIVLEKEFKQILKSRQYNTKHRYAEHSGICQTLKSKN